MRLLQAVQQANGETNFSLVEFIDDIPPYAILSHTWGADHEEVTFKDIYKGQGKGRTKPGYGKLMFCAQRATRDRIGYFWVPMIRPLFFFDSFTNRSYQIDTCCIDKSSSAELTEAINSMYKWYENSTVCYVYLSDVPRRTWNIEGDGVPVASLLGSR
ncbi:Heterokaryon incompatibility [Alternaria sp. MG1]|nr:Heterokaryon incompatibility [Alternaria sp. MG1]